MLQIACISAFLLSLFAGSLASADGLAARQLAVRPLNKQLIKTRAITGLLHRRQSCPSGDSICHNHCCPLATANCCSDGGCCSLSSRCETTNVPGVMGCCPIGFDCTGILTGECDVPGTSPCPNDPNHCCEGGGGGGSHPTTPAPSPTTRTTTFTSTSRSISTSLFSPPPFITNPFAQSTTFNDVLPSPSPGYTYQIVSAEDVRITYIGFTWVTTVSSCGTGTGRKTTAASHQITYSFFGSAIYLHAVSYNAHYVVTVDSVHVVEYGGSVEFSVAEPKNCTISFSQDKLDESQPHTITIEVQGANKAATGTPFMFEFNRFEVASRGISPTSASFGTQTSFPIISSASGLAPRPIGFGLLVPILLSSMFLFQHY